MNDGIDTALGLVPDAAWLLNPLLNGGVVNNDGIDLGGTFGGIDLIGN